MKQFLAVALSFFLFASNVSVLWAQSDSVETDVRQDRLEHRQEVKDRISDKRDEVRCHVAGVHGRRLQHRFKIYYRRLARLSEKLQNRIDRLEENNVDMSEAQGLLDEAMVKLEAANTKGDEVTTDFAQIEDGDCEEQRDQALGARDVALEVRELYKEVLELLKQVFRLVKAASDSL